VSSRASAVGMVASHFAQSLVRAALFTWQRRLSEARAAREVERWRHRSDRRLEQAAHAWLRLQYETSFHIAIVAWRETTLIERSHRSIEQLAAQRKELCVCSRANTVSVVAGLFAEELVRLLAWAAILTWRLWLLDVRWPRKVAQLRHEADQCLQQAARKQDLCVSSRASAVGMVASHFAQSLVRAALFTWQRRLSEARAAREVERWRHRSDRRLEQAAHAWLRLQYETSFHIAIVAWRETTLIERSHRSIEQLAAQRKELCVCSRANTVSVVAGLFAEELVRLLAWAAILTWRLWLLDVRWTRRVARLRHEADQCLEQAARNQDLCVLTRANAVGIIAGHFTESLVWAAFVAWQLWLSDAQCAREVELWRKVSEQHLEQADDAWLGLQHAASLHIAIVAWREATLTARSHRLLQQLAARGKVLCMLSRAKAVSIVAGYFAKELLGSLVRATLLTWQSWRLDVRWARKGERLRHEADQQLEQHLVLSAWKTVTDRSRHELEVAQWQEHSQHQSSIARHRALSLVVHMIGGKTALLMQVAVAAWKLVVTESRKGLQVERWRGCHRALLAQVRELRLGALERLVSAGGALFWEGASRAVVAAWRAAACGAHHGRCLERSREHVLRVAARGRDCLAYMAAQFVWYHQALLALAALGAWQRLASSARAGVRACEARQSAAAVRQWQEQAVLLLQRGRAQAGQLLARVAQGHDLTLLWVASVAWRGRARARRTARGVAAKWLAGRRRGTSRRLAIAAWKEALSQRRAVADGFHRKEEEWRWSQVMTSIGAWRRWVLAQVWGRRADRRLLQADAVWLRLQRVVSAYTAIAAWRENALKARTHRSLEQLAARSRVSCALSRSNAVSMVAGHVSEERVGWLVRVALFAWQLWLSDAQCAREVERWRNRADQHLQQAARAMLVEEGRAPLRAALAAWRRAATAARARRLRDAARHRALFAGCLLVRDRVAALAQGAIFAWLLGVASARHAKEVERWRCRMEYRSRQAAMLASTLLRAAALRPALAAWRFVVVGLQEARLRRQGQALRERELRAAAQVLRAWLAISTAVRVRCRSAWLASRDCDRRRVALAQGATLTWRALAAALRVQRLRHSLGLARTAVDRFSAAACASDASVMVWFVLSAWSRCVLNGATDSAVQTLETHRSRSKERVLHLAGWLARSCVAALSLSLFSFWRAKCIKASLRRRAFVAAQRSSLRLDVANSASSYCSVFCTWREAMRTRREASLGGARAAVAFEAAEAAYHRSGLTRTLATCVAAWRAAVALGRGLAEVLLLGREASLVASAAAHKEAHLRHFLGRVALSAWRGFCVQKVQDLAAAQLQAEVDRMSRELAVLRGGRERRKSHAFTIMEGSMSAAFLASALQNAALPAAESPARAASATPPSVAGPN